ncbi:DUF6603 domain-containing protein [Nodosilinea nodulosa]|uniref:DUF6603 domain-containing protein n=1 Tax=Nodosilinea nodulosa TaxID=416001 RepID=UPI0002D3116B|nr:DUF6603 domain-containing protein [Nodosilinea nodulosa]
MSDTLLDLVSREIGKFLAPIDSVVDDPELLDQLVASVGLSIPEADRDALLAALNAIVTLKTQIDTISARPSPSLSDIAALLDISRQAFVALKALDTVTGSAAEFAGFGQDLADRLVTNYLFTWHPLLRSVAALLAVHELAEAIEPRAAIVRDGELVRRAFSVDRFHFDRLLNLLRNPAAALRREYGNALATAEDASAIAQKLFPLLLHVLRQLHIPCRYGFDPDDRSLLGDAAPFLEQALIIYAEDELAGAPAEAGIVLTLSAADRGDLGLVISPFGTLTSTKLSGGWTIELQLTADVEVVAYGRHGLTLLAGDQTNEVLGHLSATLIGLDGEPGFVFGAADGTRIELGGTRFALDTALSEAQQALSLLAEVSSAAIVIAPGDADSFLGSFLPADGLPINFDLGLAWSSDRGLTLRGAGGLDATLPVGLSIGDGLFVPTSHLGLSTSDASLRAEVSISMGLSIGPVQALIDRVGIAAAVTSPEQGGNLGGLDLALGFKPPSGVGLAIDATVVTGGGFLFFDPEKEQYAGIVQLNLEGGIALTAMGLITTRLPNGAKGFSLVVMITAQEFAPIALGLGFTLTAIGGLLAINRTCNEAFLRDGIKNQTLGHLLFPQDPIRNAAQIFGTLNAAFPPRSGSYLFGPAVQICWGTPTLLKLDLALIIELGHRTRLIILGRVSANLPTEQNSLIRLQMNALGVLDFDQGIVALDAVLYDSRLLNQFPLTGGMAMRLNWGSSPNFALSIGGFHPAFKPPSGFPALQRITLSLSDTEDFRLRCSAYLAITANTLQFGARAELFVRSHGFSLLGQIGYDVLIQLDPFGFVASFYASVQLKRGSTNLFKVKVAGELAGPRPLHVRGKATFEIFWCDISIGFDVTLVKGQPPPPLVAVDVMAQLQAALNDARNWGGQLAERERRLVTLRETQLADQPLLHPLGQLSIAQRVVPLELEIAKFGHTNPAGIRFFHITSVSIHDQPVGFTPVMDSFAPSQFLALTDAEKLAAPAFESMMAGVKIGADGVVLPAEADLIEADAIAFETVLLGDSGDPSLGRSQPAQPFVLPAALLSQQLSFGAVALSDVRHTGTAKYRPDSPTPSSKYALAQPGWTVAAIADESPQTPPEPEIGQVMTYAQSFQALTRLNQQGPAQARALMLTRTQRQ